VAGAEPAPPPRPVDVAALVKELGSEDFAEREAAGRRLSRLSVDEVPPELLAALESESPEVRNRASEAVNALRTAVALTRLPRGRRFAEQGRIDLFVAATAVWDLKAEDRRLWEPPLDLGRRLIAKADMKGDRTPHGCLSTYKDFDALVDRLSPKCTRVDCICVREVPESYLHSFCNEAIQASGVEGSNGTLNTLIVSRGSVTVASGIDTSVVLANGDISARTIMRNSVLVCDGDVTLTAGHFMGCVVVARGNITAAGGASMSVLMAGGKVRLGKERPTSRLTYNVVVEEEPNTLGLTFFELLDTLGVLVKVEGGNVTVTNYKVRGAFADAGVRVGDAITAVNGRKPESAESLRRLLRDALALGDATLTLGRGEKTVTVRVSLPE
jgi:hypothetical protein